MQTSRGQSEAIGAILLVAVVVLAVSVIGTIVLTGVLDTEEPASTIVTGDVTAEKNGTVVFDHGGGDPLEASDLTIFVRNESSPQQEYPFTPGDIEGDSDERFEPGERWSNESVVSAAEGDRVRLMLVHDPTGTVLFDGTRTVE